MQGEPPEPGKFPGRSRAELGVQLVKATVSAIPVFGGPGAELLDIVIGPSLVKRRDRWIEELGEIVEELRRRLDGFDPHDLEGNEVFVSTVLATTILALKTHEDEKLRSFRNAVLNSVLPGAPDGYEQMTFLRLVDEVTPLHVHMLMLLDNPMKWYSIHDIPVPNIGAGGLLTTIELGMPNLAANPEAIIQIVSDLQTRGLTIDFNLKGVISGTSLWVSRSSHLGQNFLAFIS
jgi:hypothetical protein